MKKFVSSVLFITLVMTTSSLGFAETQVGEGPKDGDLCAVVETATTIIEEIDEMNPVSSSDRFRYEYETSKPILMSTAKISAKEAKSMDICKTIALSVIGVATPIGAGTAFAIGMASSIYGMNQAGTIESYRSVKKKIKINKVTGNRSVVGEWWTVTAKLYDAQGDLYDTKSQSYRAK